MVARCPAIRHRCPRVRQKGQRSDPSPEQGEVAGTSSTDGKKTRKRRRNRVFYGVNRSLPVIRGWHCCPAVLRIGTALAITLIRSNESQQLWHGCFFTAPLDNGLRLGSGRFPLPKRTQACGAVVGIRTARGEAIGEFYSPVAFFPFPSPSDFTMKSSFCSCTTDKRESVFNSPNDLPTDSIVPHENEFACRWIIRAPSGDGSRVAY